MDEHTVTDGYTTLTRESATPAELFDLAHDLLERLDRLEWVFSCSLLLLLEQIGVISQPDDPAAYKDTLREVHDWMRKYQGDWRKAERDREFMEAAE